MSLKLIDGYTDEEISADIGTIVVGWRAGGEIVPEIGTNRSGRQAGKELAAEIGTHGLELIRLLSMGAGIICH